MVGCMAEISPSPTPVLAEDSNPHVERIFLEHNYATAPTPQSHKQQRVLPQWLQASRDEPTTTQCVQKNTPDGVNNYASAVLNDGLLLLELRDGIHEGDGPRVICCWKFMMLYWRHSGHTKYSLETLHLLGAMATPRVAHELTWWRFVNNRGGAGNNLPVDLFMEHLNHTLKDYFASTCANVSEASIVRVSKSLHSLLQISKQFDRTSGVKPISLHHSRREYGTDLELILKELVVDSNVFDYVPGRYHYSFKTTQPHIISHVDVNKWIKCHVIKLSKKCAT